MVPFWISFIYIYLLSLASIYLFIPLQQNFHFHLDNICLFLRIFGISFPSWYHTSPILEWWILTKSHLSDLGFGGARTITFSSTALSKLTLPTMAPPFQGGVLFIITNTKIIQWTIFWLSFMTVACLFLNYDLTLLAFSSVLHCICLILFWSNQIIPAKNVGLRYHDTT